MAYPANKSFMGIDFGTTSCKFGYFINGKVEIFEDEFGNKSMPSYVAFIKDGRLVGEKAKRQMGENPRNTVFAVKKLMGKSYEDAVALGMQFPFKLIKMDHELCGIKVYNEGRKLKLYPEQVAAMLFSKMKHLTEKKLKHPVNEAVISVPPGFNSCQRKATVNAGTIAGFDDVRLVDDSTALATAISYHEMVGRETENVAIVDFGGGFTSASMITASKISFRELPSVTLEFGGIDIDENIRNILKDKLMNQNDSINDKEKFLSSAETTKILLSSQEEATISLNNERISLTSKEVNHNPHVGPKIVKIFENLTASTSGLSMNSDIDQVILTGEFTKSPFVKYQLTKLSEVKEIKKFEEFPDGVIRGAVLESAAKRGLVNRWCSDFLLSRTVKLDKDILFENYKNTKYENSKNVQNEMILNEYSGPAETPIKTGKIKSISYFNFLLFSCSPTLYFNLDQNKIILASSSYYRLLLFCMPSRYLNDFKSLENTSKEKEKKYEDVCSKKLAEINKKQKECFDSCSESFINDNNGEIRRMVTNSSISENSDLEELEKEINRLSYVQEEIKIKYAVYLKNQNKCAESSTIERCNILYPDDISKASPEDCLRLLSSLREKKQISTSTGGLTMGIDFGTSKCCVAALVGRNVEVIANEKCKKTTPSYVTFTDNERYFGKDSQHSALMMLDKTVIEPKNKIFKSESPDSVLVKCKSEDYSLNPVQISSMLIKYMKGVADNHLGQEVKDAVICVPTYFNNKHRKSIKEAAAIAGLNVLSILNEPTAAAINYKMNNSEEKTKNIDILVFDLGSGGLSVALVGIKEDKLKVYGIDGTTEVSGNVMDEKLVNHFKEEILEKQGIEIDSRKETEKLRLVCQNIRYELTGLSSTAESFENFDTTNDYKCEITKQQFEKMNYNMDEKIINILDKLFSDSNFPHSQVDEIVMCGGISRVPLMRKFLSDYFVKRGASCKISRTINEDEAVALGAAYHAACLSETKSIDPLHVEDLIINPNGNKPEKLWIAAPQEGGKLIEIRGKKHIITSSGILWNESREQNYDVEILNQLKRDVDVFNRNDEEQLQLSETRNEFESKCLKEKKKFKKLLGSKAINDVLAKKVISHCDAVLDSLGEDNNIDLSAMRKHQEEFEEFVKEINDEVKKEMERERDAAEEMERKRAAAEEMERKRATAEEMERKRATAEEMERKRATAEEMERKRATAEEMERKRATAEDVERKRATAEEMERKGATAEEMEGKRAAVEEMEGKTAGAEEMERKTAGAEEMERKTAGAEEMERKRTAEER